VAFFVTECGIWPPDKVFDVPTEELKLVGMAIARKKGEEQKFLAMIHGAKLKSRAIPTQDLQKQFEDAEQKGLPVETFKNGKLVE